MTKASDPGLEHLLENNFKSLPCLNLLVHLKSDALMLESGVYKKGFFTRKNFPEATIILNDDNISIFQKIVDGEADVMVTDAVETLVQQLIHPELEAVNPNAPFNFFEKGYLLPRDHTFKAFVDQWVNLRLKDGTYQKIFAAELEVIRKRAAFE